MSDQSAEGAGNIGPRPADPEARGVRLVVVLLSLTVVSGLIDAVSYRGARARLHGEHDRQRGGTRLRRGRRPRLLHPAHLDLAGLLPGGRGAGGRIAGRYGGGSRRTWARVTLVAETVFVGVSAVVAFVAPGATATTYTLIALTAFAMGLRNATVRKLGVPDLTTTVLTMTLTGLASESAVGDGSGHRSPRRTAAVIAMLAGAALGAWLVIHHGLGIPLLLDGTCWRGVPGGRDVRSGMTRTGRGTAPDVLPRPGGCDRHGSRRGYRWSISARSQVHSSSVILVCSSFWEAHRNASSSLSLGSRASMSVFNRAVVSRSRTATALTEGTKQIVGDRATALPGSAC
jgi:Predicted membrane protein